jgi:hypothetical protein
LTKAASAPEEKLSMPKEAEVYHSTSILPVWALFPESHTLVTKQEGE